MPSTISAGTTAGTAIAIAGDTTGNLAFQTNGTTTAMTITTAQNVGIGTTTPASKLDVFADTATFGDTGSFGFNINGTNIIFRNGIGSSTERMRIDSAGRVTLPYQPAFTANRTQGGVGANTRIVFPNVVFNIGSNYNSSTGLFTAPIAGRYLFITNTFSGNNENPYVAIRVNGVNRVWTLYSGGGGYGMASPNGILQLQANDTVEVYVYNDGVYASGDTSDCVFSGYLLG